MKKRKIEIRGKETEVEVCESFFEKARGLMFRKKPGNLLFEFKKPTRMAIHSLFCKPFKAVWMMDNKIVEEREIKPFIFSIKPRTEFNKLIEMPLKE